MAEPSLSALVRAIAAQMEENNRVLEGIVEHLRGPVPPQKPHLKLVEREAKDA